MHETLMKLAKRAIDEVFSDTSVDQEETRGYLIHLRDHLDIMIEALESDVEGG